MAEWRGSRAWPAVTGTSFGLCVRCRWLEPGAGRKEQGALVPAAWYERQRASPPARCSNFYNRSRSTVLPSERPLSRTLAAADSACSHQ